MIEMGKYVSIDVKGCGNIESSIYKTDCYFYFEQADMGAHIPCCSFAEYKLGECPCDDCTNYVPQSKVSQIVREYLEYKAVPSVEPKTGHWIPLGHYDDYGNETSYKCSECGDLDTYSDNYCPSCGVKMDNAGR